MSDLSVNNSWNCSLACSTFPAHITSDLYLFPVIAGINFIGYAPKDVNLLSNLFITFQRANLLRVCHFLTWRLPVPRRIQLFAWSLLSGKLPVRSKLASHVSDIVNVCPACGVIGNFHALVHLQSRFFPSSYGMCLFLCLVTPFVMYCGGR